jgi:hypothetical protein
MADKKEEGQAPEPTAQGQQPSRVSRGGGSVSGKDATDTGGGPAEANEAGGSGSAGGARSREIKGE